MRSLLIGSATAAVALQFSSEVSKLIGDLGSWELEGLGEQECLEDSVGGEGEDGHEHVGNHRSDKAAHHGRGDGRRDRVGLRALGEDHEAVESVESSDEEDSEDHVDRSDGADSSETSSVGDNQTE